jgi:hypothetical protein
MIDIENLADEQLELLAQRFERIRAEYDARRHRQPTDSKQVAGRRGSGSQNYAVASENCTNYRSAAV